MHASRPPFCQHTCTSDLPEIHTRPHLALTEHGAADPDFVATSAQGAPCLAQRGCPSHKSGACCTEFTWVAMAARLHPFSEKPMAVSWETSSGEGSTVGSSSVTMGCGPAEEAAGEATGTGPALRATCCSLRASASGEKTSPAVPGALMLAAGGAGSSGSGSGAGAWEAAGLASAAGDAAGAAGPALRATCCSLQRMDASTSMQAS